ncbi:MAG: 3-dehydroquinate synthase [candidate division WOR-3 bacterium]
MSNNIILIGFMGSGKDSVGKELSKRTNLCFFSMDDYITFKEKRSINRIFEESGEKYFRKIEKQTLQEIKNIKNTVIATGGGVVKDKENRELLSKIGKVVYLYATLPAIKERLKNDETRPLIKNKDNIEKIYNERMKKGIYEFADKKIDTSSITKEEVARKIIEELKIEKKWGKNLFKIIKIKTSSKTYPIIIGYDLFEKDYLNISPTNKVVVISNPLISSLYYYEIENILRKKGLNSLIFTIPSGEKYKTLDTVKDVYDFLLKEKMDRSGTILALGGGVIGDLGAFVASTFKRGIPIFHIPTTLIAQVDSSIGGKTGVDHPLGKNMIGTFYQPEKVIVDIKKLLSLPEKEFRNGLAEVIKYGIIKDAKLFYLLEEKQKEILNRDIPTLLEIVTRCIKIKKEVVEKDEKEEKGKREILNYGHTIGHIIETLTNYSKYTHGEAIAIGMVEEAKLALKEKILRERDFLRIQELVSKYQLPTSLPDNINYKEMRKFVAQDKKVRNGKIRLPVPKGIGKIIFKEVECKNFL